MNWFKEKRLGMFVHWGLYTIPAKHEQYWQRWKIPREEYIKLAKQFDPQKFNPDQIWILIRAIKVQSQILQMYVGEPALDV